MPSDTVILERAISLVNEAMFTVELQRRRVRSTEPEDERFIFRRWADLQFLVVALRRLRRVAPIAAKGQSAAPTILSAVKAFEASLPGLATMRNVGEHIDDYALDNPKRHHKQIDSRMLQAGSWDGSTYSWLDGCINVDAAYDAAMDLHRAVTQVFGSVSSPRVRSQIE
jgi:hypothetical protein